MGTCNKCGGYCKSRYKICERCYIDRQPPWKQNKINQYECKMCGKILLNGRYKYCRECAIIGGFMKNDY